MVKAKKMKSKVNMKESAKKTTSKKVILGKKIDLESSADEKVFVKIEKGSYGGKKAIQIYEFRAKKEPKTKKFVVNESFHKVFDEKGKPVHIGIKKIPIKNEIIDLEKHKYELEHKEIKKKKKWWQFCKRGRRN